MEPEKPKPALLCSASNDAEFEEIWQRLSRESRPATPPSAPQSPEPRTAEEQRADEEDELREILEHDLRPTEPRPPGWGLLTGLEPVRRRQRPMHTSDVAGSADSVAFERSRGSGDAVVPAVALAPSEPEPVRARSTNGLAAAVKAEVARRAEEQAALEARQRAQAQALDGADAEIERLKDQLAENQSGDEDAQDYDHERTDGGASAQWGSSDDEEDETAGDQRRQQRLRWAEMLRELHGRHKAQTRQKLGAHALWKAVQKEAGPAAAPPLAFVDKWVERTGRRVIRPDLPSAEFIGEWLAGRNGQQRDVADVEQWRRELNSAKATYRRLEQAHQKRPSFSNGEPTDESIEYERQVKELRREMRQLRANIAAGQIVRSEAVADGSGPPPRSAQRPPSFGSAKKWELALREIYADFVREHGVAPGVYRLRELMAAKCGARLAPRYPRAAEDRDLHPWNNDPRQIGVRVPLRSIELHRVAGHLTAFNRIPTTADSGRPAAAVSSNAYGRGW